METAINCLLFSIALGEFKWSDFLIEKFTALFNFNGLIAHPGVSDVQRIDKNQDLTETIFDVLERNLRVFQLSHGDTERLAVMLVKGAPHPRLDLRAISDRFAERSIPLFIVSTEIPSTLIWDFYQRSARHTGGEYLTLSCAVPLLNKLILTVMEGRSTVREAAFRMHSENPMLDGVGDLPFDHGSSD